MESDNEPKAPKCDQCGGELIDPYPWPVKVAHKTLHFTVCGECHGRLVRQDTRDIVYPEQAKRLMTF